MKLIVTYTIFSDDWNFIKFFVDKVLQHIDQELNFKILKHTTGRHQESTRNHYHIMVLYDTTKAKYYKILNKKLQTIINSYLKEQQEIKISYIYEGETKKFKGEIKTYNEGDMCYPFKEYTEDNHIDIIMDLQRGYQPVELYAMRKHANKLWTLAKAKKEQIEKNKSIKEQDKQKLEDYLKEQHNYCIHSGFDDNLRAVVKDMLVYYKLNDIAFNVSSLKNKAINFLYFNGIVNETNIADYILR